MAVFLKEKENWKKLDKLELELWSLEIRIRTTDYHVYTWQIFMIYIIPETS